MSPFQAAQQSPKSCGIAWLPGFTFRTHREKCLFLRWARETTTPNDLRHLFRHIGKTHAEIQRALPAERRVFLTAFRQWKRAKGVR